MDQTNKRFSDDHLAWLVRYAKSKQEAGYATTAWDLGGVISLLEEVQAHRRRERDKIPDGIFTLPQSQLYAVGAFAPEEKSQEPANEDAALDAAIARHVASGCDCQPPPAELVVKPQDQAIPKPRWCWEPSAAPAGVKNPFAPDAKKTKRTDLA